jgi:hypothetical protein
MISWPRWVFPSLSGVVRTTKASVQHGAVGGRTTGLDDPGARPQRYRLELFRLRLPLVLFRRDAERLRALLELLRVDLAFALPPALRRLVAAPLRAARERADLERAAEAAPPFLPPLRDEVLVLFRPRPDPLFFPPPSSLFTVAQARRAASRPETPRFS